MQRQGAAGDTFSDYASRNGDRLPQTDDPFPVGGEIEIAANNQAEPPSPHDPIASSPQLLALQPHERRRDRRPISHLRNFAQE